MHVHEDEIVGASCKALQRFGAGPDGLCPQAEGLEQQQHRAAVNLMVVDHQDRETAERFGVRGRSDAPSRRRGGASDERHLKARAGADTAGNRDIAAHHAGQLAADGQAKTGATMRPGNRVVALPECGKQA